MMKWNDKQLEAIARGSDLSPNNRIFAVSGGPGTGKTTLIRAIHDQLSHMSVVIAAPTGRAAKRVTEATGIPAKTIHRLLEYPYPGERDEHGKALAPGLPKRNAQHKLDEQVVLVDEASMIHHSLYKSLIAAMRRDGYLRLFGDISQLQPIEQQSYIGLPSPYKTVLGKGNCVELTEIMRTAADSNIPHAAEAIKAGRNPRRSDDFQLLITQKPQEWVRNFVLNDDYDVNEHQIITPQTTKFCGTNALNKMVQQLVGCHPSMRHSFERHKWDKEPVSAGPGDRVLWTENTYDLRQEYDRYTPNGGFIAPDDTHQIMNGECGTVLAVTDGGIDIDFGDRVVSVPYELVQYSPRQDTLITIQPLKSCTLGYVITTHKAQGSEWPHIVYIANSVHSWMLCRPNIYTAVTRARKRVSLIADMKGLQTSLTPVRSRAEAKDLASARAKQQEMGR